MTAVREGERWCTGREGAAGHSERRSAFECHRRDTLTLTPRRALCAWAPGPRWVYLPFCRRGSSLSLHRTACPQVGLPVPRRPQRQVATQPPDRKVRRHLHLARVQLPAVHAVQLLQVRTARRCRVAARVVVQSHPWHNSYRAADRSHHGLVE